MRASWIICGTLVMAACKGNERPVASTSGSSAAPVATTVADAHVTPPPKLAISCGPAMLAPRVPAPRTPPKEAPLGVGLSGGDSYGVSGLGLQSPPGIYNDGQGTIGIGDIGQGPGLYTKTTASPSLKFAAFVTQGPIDKPIVERMFKRRRPHFMRCYEQELLKDPTVKGTVVVQLVIDGKGKVKNANATGVAGPCVQAALIAMGDFPPASEDAITLAKVQMQFEPGKQTSSPRDDRYNRYGAVLGNPPKPKPKPKAVPPPAIADARSWTPYAASVGLASTDVAQAAGTSS